MALTTSLRGFAFAKIWRDGNTICKICNEIQQRSIPSFPPMLGCWALGTKPRDSLGSMSVSLLCPATSLMWFGWFRHEEVEYARHPSAATSRHDLEHARRLVCFGNCCMSFCISVSARLRVYVCKPANLRVDVNISISYLWHMNTNDIKWH